MININHLGVSEKGTFLSSKGFIRDSAHAWSEINPLFSEFRPCHINYKPYSFNAVPYLWMMKNKASDVDPHYSVVADNYEIRL